MSLQQALSGSLAIESAENYSIADVAAQEMILTTNNRQRVIPPINSDSRFWRRILGDAEGNWGREFSFRYASVSEWIARVPGLFWMPGAKAMRQISPALIEIETDEWSQYAPPGKTQKIAGGMGTLRLPPNDQGYRVVSITTSANASAGIPALIAPEIWDEHKIAEGCLLRGIARWRPMSLEWSGRFPMMRGLPRGYLVLDRQAEVNVRHRGAPVMIAPYSIMSYNDNDLELYDYVYAITDSSDKTHRQEVEKFFDKYKDDNGRLGRYLIGSDVVNPMWDSEYNSPEDIRKMAPAATSYLKIVCEHIRQRSFTRKSLDDILRFMTSVMTIEDLRRISDDLGISPVQWEMAGPNYDSYIRFMEKLLEKNKMEELIVELALQYPDEFRREGANNGR